ncbi:alpha/beta fold hydrolase [Deinococcus cellulosilyticus]|uniref:Hydrolase n=1 Tax=Deinococcus cellulosilyticus (strain DSM 18568 / NBRC 106333 / KACC 11606 / 5516J-15) TaxID=1223518 RepID=A0A511N5I2_DEIC1|nr:alpha/beta hydrolase [Deinococcus cellulosilyticus]GEM48120.1 hydrolase [Deinococcus cellulosilyticus NBRC 106333 = KACC 11606]
MNDDVMVVDDGQETPKAQPKIRVYGAGSPVLLLSGGPGFSADYMEPLARELELQYQAVLPDLRGTGTNTVEETPENLSLDAHVEDVENIRKQYGWDKFSFVAHSSGAQIALAYALKYPHFVKSIALLDPAGTDTGYLEEFNRVADSRLNRLDKEILADWKAGNGDFTEGLTTLLYRVVFDRRTANKIVEMVPQKSFFNQKTAEVYTQGLVDSGFNITDRLGELSSIPVYVAHGLLDPLPYEVGKSIAEKTGGKFVLQDNCGHFPWIEVPREFYPQFLGFLFQNAW